MESPVDIDTYLWTLEMVLYVLVVQIIWVVQALLLYGFDDLVVVVVVVVVVVFCNLLVDLAFFEVIDVHVMQCRTAGPVYMLQWCHISTVQRVPGKVSFPQT
jgi:hypothetical protein